MSELKDVSLQDLLGLHAGVIEELRRRGAARSANNPTGSLAEFLFCRAFSWQQASNSEKGFDASDGDGRRYQNQRAAPGSPEQVASAVGEALSSCGRNWQSRPMTGPSPSYRGYRFPPEIISHAVWLYHRFCLSFRDVEDLLAQRGVTVSYETIHQWCQTFGLDYARKLRRRRGRLGDTWYLDEVFVTFHGRRQHLWRAVDQDGDVLDILVQSRRDRRAAARFFRKVLKGQGRSPRRLVTDKLRSYSAAHRTVMPSVVHSTRQYANNRAEVSHQPTRQRERQMRRFKSAAHAQRFLSVHGLVLNLFRVGRHLLRSAHHRLLRMRAFPNGMR